MRILFVDDNELFLRGVVRDFKRLGHEVATACSADAAVIAADAFQPEGIITDLQLGGSSGIELVLRLRRHGHRSPTVVLTGLQNWSLPESLEGVVVRYKPCTSRALIETLQGMREPILASSEDVLL